MGRYADRLKKEKEAGNVLLRDTETEKKTKSESYADRLQRERYQSGENVRRINELRSYLAEQSAKRSAERGENALLRNPEKKIKKDLDTYTWEKKNDRYVSKIDLGTEKDNKTDLNKYSGNRNSELKLTDRTMQLKRNALPLKELLKEEYKDNTVTDYEKALKNDYTGYDNRAYEIMKNGTSEKVPVTKTYPALENIWDNNSKKNLTANERGLYNYIKFNEGQKAADSFMEYMSKELNRRESEKLNEKVSEFADEHPVLASVASVEANLLKPAGTVKNIADTISGKGINEYGVYNMPARIQKTARNTVGDNIGNKPGRFMYDVGMSMADFLTNAAVANAVGGASGSASSFIANTLIGTQAANDTVISAKDRGLNDTQAMSLGAVAGVAEIITEKYSLENLLNSSLKNPTGLKYMLKNIVAEGSEEAASDVINEVADVLIAADKSELRTAIKEYVRQGYTDKEAFGKAVGDFAVEMGMDALAGAVSGGIMAGGALLSDSNIIYSEQARDKAEQLDRAETKEELQNIFNDIENEEVKKQVQGHYMELMNGFNSDENIEKTAEVTKAIREYEKTKEKQEEEIKDEKAEEEEPEKDILEELKEEPSLSKTDKAIARGEVIPFEEAEYNGKTINEINENSKAKDTMIRNNRRLSVVKNVLESRELNDNQVKSLATLFADEVGIVTGKEVTGNTVNEKMESVKEIAEEFNRTQIKNNAVYEAKVKGKNTKLQGIAKITANSIIVNTDNGKTELSDVKFNNNVTEKLYNMSKSFDNAEAANNFINGYNERVPLDAYKLWYNKIYMSGMSSLGFDTVTRNIDINFAGADVAAKAYKDGYNQAVKNSKKFMSEDQKTAVRKLARMLNREVYIVKDLKGANGMIKDGKIYISELSDNFGITVLAHEVTHSLKQTSPEAYNKYEKFVTDYFKENYENEYNKELKRLKRLYKTDDMALLNEEMAAFASEKFLYDSEAVEDFCNENKSIGQKILDTIKNILEKLKELLKGYHEQSAEAKMLNADIEAYDTARQLWYDALKNENARENEDSTRFYKKNGNNIYNWIYDKNFSDKQKIFSNKGEGRNRAGRFYGELNYIKKHVKNKEGWYVVPIDNMIYYTNGDKDYAIIDRIIEVNSEDSLDVEQVMEDIINYEKRNKQNDKLEFRNVGELVESEIKYDDTIESECIIREYSHKHRTKSYIINKGANKGRIYGEGYENSDETIIRDAGNVEKESNILQGETNENNGRKDDGSDKGLQGESGLRKSLKDIPDFSDSWLDTVTEDISEVKDILSEGFGLLRDYEVDEAAVNTIARRLKKEYQTQYNMYDLSDNLKKVFAYLHNNEKVSYDDMLAITAQVTRPVIEQSTYVDKDELKYIRDFKRTVRNTPISLDETQKKELDYYYDSKRKGKTGYEQFRRDSLGTFVLSDKGYNIDTLWQTFVDASYGALSLDTNSQDMITELKDYIDSLSPTVYNLYGNEKQSLDNASYDMALRVFEEYFKYAFNKNIDVNKKLAKQREKLNKEASEWRIKQKAKYVESLKTIKEEDRVQREKLKEQYRKKVAGIKDEEKKKAEMAKEKYRQMMYDKLTEQKALNAERLKNRTQNLRDTQRRNELKKRINANVISLAKLINNPTDKKHVPDKLRYPVAKLIKTVDIISQQRVLESDSAKDFAEYWRQNMLEIQSAINAMETDGLDEYGVGNYSDFLFSLDPDFKGRLSNWLDSTKYYNIKDNFNIQELEELDYLIKTMKHCINLTNEMYANGMNEKVSKVASKTIEELNNKNPYKDKKFKSLRKLWDIEMLDPFNYFEMLGKGAYSVFQEIRDGFDTRVEKIDNAQKYMEKVLKGTDVKRWTGKHADTIKYRGTEYTVGQAMSLYCLSKREQAKLHIEKGGIRLVDDTGKVSDDTEPVHLTLKDVDNITKKLSPEQIKVADRMQQYMSEECSEWGNEVSKKMYGYRKFTEKYYFPIKSDSNYTRTSDSNSGTDMGAGNSNGSLYAIRNQGMTKSLIRGANNPIMVSDIFDVFTDHVVSMATYNAYVIPLMDAMKWYNYRVTEEGGGYNTNRSVKQAMERSYGSEAKAYFIRLMKDINGESGAGNYELSERLISNYKASAVGVNIRVALQQPTSYLRAANVMDAKYLTEAMALSIGKLRKSANEVIENSPIAKWKSWGYYETSIGKSMKNVITGFSETTETIKEKSMMLAQIGDDVTWGVLYNAVKLEISDKNKGLDKDSDKYKKLVNERFNEVVDRTQVVDTIIHRSQIMRRKDLFTKTLMSFMAEPTRSFNLLGRAIRTGDKKIIARSFWLYILSNVVTSAAASLADAFRDNDDKELYEKYISSLKDNIIDNVNPLNMLPYAKDFISIYNGWNSKRMDTEGLQYLVYAIKEWEKVKNTGEGYYKAIRHSTRAFSMFTGIPVFGALREAETVYNYFSDENLGEVLTDSQKVLRAIEKDEDIAETIDAAVENGTKTSTIKSAITRKYKPEYLNGDSTRRKEIRIILGKTGLYGDSEDISETLDKWLEQAEDKD